MTELIEKKRPFKKFYCDDDAVFLLPPVAFKIWIYHYRLERKERKSSIDATTLCKRLGGIDPNTLFKWRKHLVSTGWLELLSNDIGKEPVFRAARGQTPVPRKDGRAGNDTAAARAALPVTVPGKWSGTSFESQDTSSVVSRSSVLSKKLCPEKEP
jgi:hypothetical protein